MIAQSDFVEGKVVITTSVKNILQNPCADNHVIQTEYPLFPCNLKSLLQELCYMQQMQHHKDTSAY